MRTFDVRIADRGESLVYTARNRSLTAQLHGWTLDVWATRQWSDGEPVGEFERAQAISRMRAFLTSLPDSPGCEVVAIPPETAEEELERFRRAGYEVELVEGKIIFARAQFNPSGNRDVREP
jgi:hypothetical protein